MKKLQNIFWESAQNRRKLEKIVKRREGVKRIERDGNLAHVDPSLLLQRHACQHWMRGSWIEVSVVLVSRRCEVEERLQAIDTMERSRPPACIIAPSHLGSRPL